MYAIVKTDAAKNINDEGAILGVTKTFKTYQAALRYVIKQNEMISTQSLNIKYYVYDETKGSVFGTRPS